MLCNSEASLTFFCRANTGRGRSRPVHHRVHAPCSRRGQARSRERGGRSEGTERLELVLAVRDLAEWLDLPHEL